MTDRKTDLTALRGLARIAASHDEELYKQHINWFAADEIERLRAEVAKWKNKHHVLELKLQLAFPE